MRKLFHLAAALTLLTAATTHAQITNPNDLIAPPPQPIQFHGKHLIEPVADFQWLWQYTLPLPDGNEAGLIADPHFREMLKNNFKAPQSFYRDGALPLAEVAEQYFGMIFSPVEGIDNRYITFNSCVPHDCIRQGLIWVDTATQHPVIVFAATEWTTEGKPDADPDATFNLWVFSNRALDIEHLPPALITAISQWNGKKPQHIQTALLVDPDGTPHKINPAILGATPAN
jgi:hypothetical protein